MLAFAMLPLVRRFGATMLVHADLDAARLCDGVHLPASADVSDARARLGADAWIGLSCHTLKDVQNAASAGADYVTLGPFAETKSKPGYTPTLTWEDLEQATKIGISVLALGGIDETNARLAREAGARGIAAMGSVMRSDDPESAVRRLLEAWET